MKYEIYNTAVFLFVHKQTLVMESITLDFSSLSDKQIYDLSRDNTVSSGLRARFRKEFSRRIDLHKRKKREKKQQDTSSDAAIALALGKPPSVIHLHVGRSIKIGNGFALKPHRGYRRNLNPHVK